jgi:hypothetical protein
MLVGLNERESLKDPLGLGHKPTDMKIFCNESTKSVVENRTVTILISNVVPSSRCVLGGANASFVVLFVLDLAQAETVGSNQTVLTLDVHG